jgi:DNA-binding MarR family transcriptional regulator
MKQFASFGGILFRKTQTFMKAVYKKLGFSFLETIILDNVCENPGTTQDMIAYNLVLDDAAVTRSLKQLEKRKLIRREIDPDNQRRKKIYPLPKAETFKKETNRIMEYWNTLLFHNFSKHEQEELVIGLQKLQQNAVSINVDQVVQTILE